jgi:hypothetical protein
MKKAGSSTVDLDAPLDTSLGRPISNKTAKATLTMAASSKRVKTSIDKWKAEVTTHSISLTLNAWPRQVLFCSFHIFFFAENSI